MNVLVVAQYFPPDIGGSATRAFNIAKGLALNGCGVTVITAFPHYPHGNIPKKYQWKPIEVEQLDGLKVIRTFMPPIKSEGFFKRIILILSFAVSSLFAFPFVGKFNAVWTSSFIPGIIYGRLTRSPVALNVDDVTLEDIVDLKLIDENSFILKMAKRVYRVLYSKGDDVTTVSPAYNKILINNYFVKPEKIHFIRGGVNLSSFDKGAVKKPLKFNVLYSGAFSIAYDFEQIFKAAKLIEARDGDIEFVIQGNGEQLDSMRSRANELQVHNVRIIDKLISRDEIGAWLGSADALILPLADFQKPYRGISTKLYEYQAAGKPIICCSKGVPRDYVLETNSGMAVYPGDYQALAEAVMELKTKPDFARTMGENGKKYVEAEASIEAIGFKVKNIFYQKLFAK